MHRQWGVCATANVREEVNIGQTGQCMNDRLREHTNNVRDGAMRAIAASTAKTVGAMPQNSQCYVVASRAKQITREVTQAVNIAKWGTHA